MFNLNRLRPMAVAIGIICLISAGCNAPETGAGAGSPDKSTAASGHSHTAPHGGHLIDLGRSHKYHAEIHDNHDTDEITVYVLDQDLKPLSIDQPSVSLVVTAAGQTETFELAANEGTTSEFSSKDKALIGYIDSEDLEGKLRVTIDGNLVTGTFGHFHDHGHVHGDDGHDQAND